MKYNKMYNKYYNKDYDEKYFDLYDGSKQEMYDEEEFALYFWVD